MKRAVIVIGIFFLCFTLIGCASHMKFSKSYDNFMNQAERLAAVLCSHSEFSVCYWKSALGQDIGKMPAEAMEILEEIERTVKGKKVEDLTQCEKAKLLGLWQRFGSLVGKDLIERVVPFMVKFVGVL